MAKKKTEPAPSKAPQTLHEMREEVVDMTKRIFRLKARAMNGPRACVILTQNLMVAVAAMDSVQMTLNGKIWDAERKTR